MTIESARRHCLTIAFVCALVSALPAASFAKPRQGTGTHTCGCQCDVVLGDGTKTFVAANFSLPSQYACTSANNKVCNVSDPVTGGVRQGNLMFCGDGALHVTNGRPRLPVTNPAGGFLQAVPMR